MPALSTRVLTTAVAVAGTLSLAPTAGANTVVTYTQADGLQVMTDPGEENAIQFRQSQESEPTARQAFTVTDAQTFVLAGSGCSGGGVGGTVTCIADGPLRATISLGPGPEVDGAQIIVGSGLISPIDVRIDLGPGNDSYFNFTGAPPGFTGSNFNPDSTIAVEGGDGDDRFVAADGRETLTGGAGVDEMNLNADDAVPDVVNCGAGVDRLVYSGLNPVPVNISVDGQPNDGEPGSTDNVIACEDVSAFGRATAGTDGGTLIGNAGSNRLVVFGPAGLSPANHRIEGRAGGDILHGGDGADTILGGDGNDSTIQGNGGADRLEDGLGSDIIRARDGVADTIVCDRPETATQRARASQRPAIDRPGNDLALIDLVDPLPARCERVERANRFELPNVQIRGTRLSVTGGNVRGRLACPRAARRACRGTLRSAAVTRRGRETGRGRPARFRLRPGRSRSIRVRVTGAARRALAADSRARLRLTSVEPATRGPGVKTTTLTAEAR